MGVHFPAREPKILSDQATGPVLPGFLWATDILSLVRSWLLLRVIHISI